MVATGCDVLLVHADGTLRRLLAVDGVVAWTDCTVDPAGRVLVGALRSGAPEVGLGVPGELWRIAADGATPLYDGVEFANGVGLSPDGRTLYQADSSTRTILAHDLDDAGRATNRRTFARTPVGMPDGLAFGGADRRDLYVTTGGNDEQPAWGGTLFRGRVDVPGLPVPAARV